MPRGPRLDAPGVLHHIMVRGIEATDIFRTDRDRVDFLTRVATLAPKANTQVFAWALLPNHCHLLLRTGRTPLASLLRRLLTGYAVGFNRRHKRHGHLFQNRYKSIVVEQDPYLLELMRYIHLNPLRAGLVRDLRTLDRYPWSGHSAVMGYVSRPWQAVDAVLGHFATTVRVARRRYRAFLALGVGQGHRPDLQGGGLRRSAGGWAAIASLRRGRELWTFDERVLGSGDFVEQLLHAARPTRPSISPDTAGRQLTQLIEEVAQAFGVSAVEIAGGSRRRVVAGARATVAVLAIKSLGQPISRVAEALGVTPPAIFHAMRRGEAHLRQRRLDPDRLIERIQRKVK